MSKMSTRTLRRVAAASGVAIVLGGALTPGVLGAASHAAFEFTGSPWVGAQAPRMAPQQSLSAAASSNWAGYEVTPTKPGNLYTSITGSWTVPKVTGSPGDTAAQWIGLGGVKSHDLLQTGTIEQLTSTGQQDMLFWEKLPKAETPMVAVPTGSKVTASIQQGIGDLWVIKLTVTPPSGAPFTKTVTVPVSPAYAHAIGQTGEWISEDPSTEHHELLPLGNSGTVTYSDATVNGQPMKSPGNSVQPIAMVGPFGFPELVPSTVASTGTGFQAVTQSGGGNPFGIPSSGILPGGTFPISSLFPSGGFNPSSPFGNGSPFGNNSGSGSGTPFG
ncbi:MAG: G1 family endopeptidase, partial [Firmicutes bacterium]|nr:G1 family endopeptidase [Bacillota bacterium]